MPIVKVLDRNVLYIYDRFDDNSGNRRKKLVKGKEVFVSDKSLAALKRFGIHFEVIGEGDLPVDPVPPVEEKPVEEKPVEETPVEETPAEETPVEEAPKEEEKPVEETPVEEPVVEAPKETEEPVDEKPETEEVEFGGEVLKVTKKKSRKKKKK